MENTTPREIATAAWAKADGMAGERGITYGINRGGKHVIRIDWPAGEDIAPDFYRFETADEARECWRKFVTSWRAAGYIPAAEYWEVLKRQCVAAA